MTNEIDNGGPAFPCDVRNFAIPQEISKKNPEFVKEMVFFTSQGNGMSLRDWFAGMALQGILASCPHGLMSDGLPLESWANTSFKMAAAMLKERTK